MSVERTSESIYAVASQCKNCEHHQIEADLQCDNCGAVLVTGLKPGTVIADRYEYLETIGAGGMGLIVKARDSKSSEVVALKLMLLSHNPSDVRRFQLEAKAASMLTHEHIIRVLDFGSGSDHFPYMTMEFLEGINLGQKIATKGSLELAEALDIFDQICDAMAYAHDNGIIHRDIKPANIMLTGRYRSDVKLVDFGIAKVLDQSTSETNLTKTGHILGSPLYMSPEQASGKKADKRSDIYSAGCVLYHALTGAPPIEGSTAIETLLKHLNTIAVPLSQASLGKKFPEQLEDIVARTLSKDPNARPQSFEELRKELQQACNQLAVMADNNVIKAPHAVWHHWQRWAGVGAFAAILIGVGSGVYLNFPRHWQRPLVAPFNAPAVKMSRGQKVAAIAGATSKDMGIIAKYEIKEENKDHADATDPMTVAGDLMLGGNEGTKSSTPSQRQKGLPKLEITGEDAVDNCIDFGNGKFELANNKKIDDNAVRYLAEKMKGKPIQFINLSGTHISKDAIQALIHTNVAGLSIGWDALDSNCLAALSRISSLEDLRITNLHVSGRAMADLGKLKKLKHLDLTQCDQLYGVDCAFIKNLDLDSLTLNTNPHLGPEVLPYILTQKNLSDLKLVNLSIPSQVLPQLTKLKYLTTLQLLNRDTSREDLANIAKIPRLANLNLQYCHLTDDAFDTLKTMHEFKDKLKNLVVFEARIGGQTISAEQIAALKNALGPGTNVIAKDANSVSTDRWTSASFASEPDRNDQD